MLIQPTLQEARRLAVGNTVVPVSLEMFADVKTSMQILRNIRARSSRFYVLESVKSNDSWGRYTFLGYDPAITVEGADGVTHIRSGAHKQVELGNPVELLRKMLAEYRSPRVLDLPPFTGGFVGYFSYDFIKYLQPGLKLRAANDAGLPDFQLMLMDKVIAFDHFKQKIYLIVNVPVDDFENRYVQGVAVLKDMERMILATPSAEEGGAPVCGPFEAAYSRERYCAMVERAKARIVEGDIFQVVLSNRFTADFSGDLLETFRVLRTTNPSPYMAYLSFDDLQVACASPETLISLRDGKLNTYPLAGTCPRGATREEDAALEEALLHDEKELAEHDMLVDLSRNDIGKVAEFGSVQVREYRQIKRFTHVSHISSRATGRLRQGMDAIDALAATLPAGTLSGAPKKRACEIIDELEGVRRGVYGGAIGYIDFTGNMDLCIGIRMAVLKNGKVTVQAGAGIVADSLPEKEYEETLNKAKGVMNALQYGKGGAQGGTAD